MKDPNEPSHIIPEPHVVDYASPATPPVKRSNSEAIHALSVMAGAVSMLGMIAWGWPQYISKIGPLGILAMPFVPIAIGGLVCGLAASFRGRRSRIGLILNGCALLLFMTYAGITRDFFWMAP